LRESIKQKNYFDFRRNFEKNYLNKYYE